MKTIVINKQIFQEEKKDNEQKEVKTKINNNFANVHYKNCGKSISTTINFSTFSISLI